MKSNRKAGIRRWIKIGGYERREIGIAERSVHTTLKPTSFSTQFFCCYK